MADLYPAEPDLPAQLLYHVDPDTGRELIIHGWGDGTALVRIYRTAAAATTRYEVEIPAEAVAELQAALTGHLWMHS